MSSFNMFKTNICNLAIKVLIYLFEFINISLIIHYLGDYIYGEWVTIVTIFLWINSCDLGIGNGLRNTLTLEISNKNIDKIRGLISTCYIIMSALSLLFVLVGMVLVIGLIHVNFYDRQFLYPLVVCVLGFCFNFVVGLSRSVGYSYQKSEYIIGTQLLTSIFTCIGVVLISKFSNENLLLFSVVYMVCMIAPNLFLMVLLQYYHKEEYKISLKYFMPQYIKGIIALGIKFFVLQAIFLIMYSTDTIILKILVGSEAVTRYDIIDKIFKAGNELFSVLLIATWSAVTYALSKNDFKWIKDNLEKLIKIWCVFSVGVLIVMFAANPVIKIWMQSDKYIYSLFTRITFALHCILLAWNGIFVNISNGLGHLNVQLKSSVFAIVVNIPLSIWLVKYLKMGVAGVKIGTIISLLCIAIPLTYDILHYINENVS